MAAAGVAANVPIKPAFEILPINFRRWVNSFSDMLFVIKGNDESSLMKKEPSGFSFVCLSELFYVNRCFLNDTL